MSSQEQLLYLMDALKSNRKREKLNGLEQLTELLKQDEVVKSLLENFHSEDKALNWDILFKTVHDATLYLIDDSSAKGKKIFNRHIQIIDSVICEVVQKSVFQKCLLISPGLLASSTLAVFESNIRVKHLGFIYLHIFSKYVMSEKNWCSLKKDYWIGMKNVCKKYFKNPPQGINSILFLQNLIEIVRFSSKTCQISHDFLDLFAFLRDIYVSKNLSGSDFENTLLHLTNTVCLQMAAEFRYKVCEFMENMFDYVKTYHKHKNPRKNTLVYHFFKTSLSIHNPNGLVDKKITYACNLDKWKSQIKEMYYICYDAIDSMLKNPINQEMEMDLLLLFVDLSHLLQASEYGFDNIFEIENSDMSFGEPGPSNKRKCSSESFGPGSFQAKQIKLDFTLSNLLSNLSGPDAWFWLKFLELLISKYPQNLKTDYYQLVELLCKLICEKKNSENIRVAIRCLSSLLDLENSFLPEFTGFTSQWWLDDMWNKISVELIRSLHTETNVETHMLIRSLISQFRLQDIEPLVMLYCDGTLQPEIENFKTLCTICQHCILPEILSNERGCKTKEENVEGVRERLLHWLLAEEKFPCSDLAKVLVVLLLKKFEEDTVISNLKDSALISQINIDDFCELITQGYLTVAFKNINFVKESSATDSSFEIRIESVMKEKLFDLLSLKSKCLVDALYKEDVDHGQSLKALEDCWWFVELMCHLLSYFECGSDDCMDCTNLTSILKSTLFSCSGRTLNLMTVKIFDLSCISRLYSLNIHHNVQKKIRQPDFMNMELLKLAYDLFEDCSIKTEDSMDNLGEQLKSVSRFSQLMKNPKSILHFQSLNGREKLMVSLVELLCQYITLPVSLDSNYYQFVLTEKIMKHLTCDKLVGINSDFYVQLVLRVVYTFTKYDAISITTLEDCLYLMDMVFCVKKCDFEVIITALQVFKDLACLVQKAGNADMNRMYKKILAELAEDIVIGKTCGVKAACKFIECLAELAKINLEGNSEPGSGSSRVIIEELIAFLKHPYHEVRMTAAQYVGLLFVHDKNSKHSTRVWQKRMFRELSKVLRSDSESLLGTAEERVLEYHRCLMASISLISWAGVICLSTYWRKKALFHLIHLAHLKNFPRDAVEDVVKLICRELKIDEMKYISLNLPYLFYIWAEKGLEIQDFPFYLLRCETVDEFLLNHTSTVLTTYAALGQLDKIKQLPRRMKTTIDGLLKDFHSELLAFIMPSLKEKETMKVIDDKWKAERMKNAEKLNNFIITEIDPVTSFRLLMGNLDKFLYNMIRNMHDPQYLLNLCDFRGNLKDDRNPVGCGVDEIMKTLESLGKKDKFLLGRVGVEEPSVIEKVLRGLLKDVVTAIIYEEKVFAFYKYIFFVEAVGKTTTSGLEYRNIKIFFVRDVSYSLAAILRDTEDEVLTDMACECFRKLGASYLEEFSSVLGQFLTVITTALTPCVKRGNVKALQVLSFFITENYSKLKPHIALLDFFPTEENFRGINEQIKKTQVNVKDVLKNAIKNFIRIGRSENSGCRAVSLENLCHLLSERKSELKEMYDELKLLRGFSEDCKRSLLHQLIRLLVELTTSENTDIRVGAAKCLGELGPADLTTLVLNPENNFTVSKSKVPAIRRLLRTALGILPDLLVSDSNEVKEASSRALYAISSTTEGREIMRGSEETLENVEYLTPFQSKYSYPLHMNINTETFLRKFGERELWRPGSHDKWVVKLTETLLESFVDSSGIFNAFLQLIRLNWQFAENIFPACLDFALSFDDRNCKEVINKNISAFFEENFNYKDKSSPTVNKQSVQCILNVIDYIRVQRNHERPGRGFDFSVNFLHVAKASLYCSAFFTSIFYAELWFEDKRRKVQAEKLLYVDINTICEIFPEEGVILAEILRKCHFEIGNLDGIHGCGYMHILNSSSEIQHYEHLENWNLSVLHHDVQLCQGKPSSEIGLFQSLEGLGLYHTLSRLTETHLETPQSTEVLYRCSTRMSDWNQLDSTYKRKNNCDCISFEKCHYFALKAFHEEDEVNFQNECRKARNTVLGELANCSLESSKNFYLLVTKLQRLKETEEFASVLRGARVGELNKLFKKWNDQDNIKCSEFKLVESILSNRTVMILDAWKREKNCEIKDCLQGMLRHFYYKTTVAARKDKKYDAAIRNLMYFDDVHVEADELTRKMKVEKARILWERGDRETGRFLLNYFLKKDEIGDELKMKSLRLYGDWMAKTNGENFRDIIENYYLKSIAQSTESDNRIEAYASLANFAYEVYVQFNEYLSSPLFETKKNLISTQQDMALVWREELHRNQTREKRLAYQIAEKQRVIDENEIKNIKAERDTYLVLALKFYLQSLKDGDKYNLNVFRVVSLWLSNSNNSKVIREVRKALDDIPTYKFLCLLPQLIPRMADVPLIDDLLERILQDHPHHTLPPLFAMMNSYADLRHLGGRAPADNPRVWAACHLVERFERDEKLQPMIKEMRTLTEALIELANYGLNDKSKPGKSPVTFPEHLQIRQLANLTSIAVPSISIPYKKNCVYDKVIGILGFEQEYVLVGGINMPKRITCIGTDGVRRSLLLKGRDDLRQDAVMQQVFTVMNTLLKENKETSKRKLVIRTYKVVPLSQRSGVIEWCENTESLSSYLTGPDGRSGAHKTYYPDDASPLDCRLMIKKVFSKPRVTNQDKLKVFMEACRRLHPVFHNFFLEHFGGGTVWFERRLAYTRSVATSSMIGYILGIGDRHVQNILIDNATAEVIHIDLGIAFERGRTLPTPETVPFRLTRDIVDGMGPAGVEGDFRISCTHTMEVLRNNQATILTLLEVLLYDPLHTWTLTHGKAYSIQNHTEDSSTTKKSSTELETNKMAERVLLRLKQKLQGIESGYGTTTVQGQVGILINEARDPNNLSRLFHGWQAYL